MADFNPERVFHWGYVVRDMPHAVRSWTDWGAQIVVPPAPDPIQKVECCLLILKGSAPIELVAPLNAADSPLHSRLAKGGGLDHVCFFTGDLEADLASCVEKGSVTVVEPCYGAVFDRRLAFVVTRFGLLIELMECKAEGKASTDPLEHFPVPDLRR